MFVDDECAYIWINVFKEKCTICKYIDVVTKENKSIVYL